MMKLKQVELVKVAKKNYLISRSDEIIEDLCIFSIGGSLIEAYPGDILGPDILWVAKVIAGPNEIGYIDAGDKTEQVGDLINTVNPIIRKLDQSYIDMIDKNDGKCWIEMEEVPEQYFEFPITYPSIKLVPRLLNGKVIIHLYE